MCLNATCAYTCRTRLQNDIRHNVVLRFDHLWIWIRQIIKPLSSHLLSVFKAFIIFKWKGPASPEVDGLFLVLFNNIQKLLCHKLRLSTIRHVFGISRMSSLSFMFMPLGPTCANEYIINPIYCLKTVFQNVCLAESSRPNAEVMVSDRPLFVLHFFKNLLRLHTTLHH